MKAIVLPDSTVILLRILCVILTIVSTIRIDQSSLSAIFLTLVAFYLLKKRSKYIDEISRHQIKNEIEMQKHKDEDEEKVYINDEIENPFRKSKKLNYSELPNHILNKAENDLINFFLMDYSFSKSLNGFQVIKSHTECHFAKHSNLWGAPLWNVDIEVEENIKNCIPSFILFCNFCTYMKLDGYVIELPGWVYGDDLNIFAKIFCKILQELSDADPNKKHCMDMQNIESPSWVFEFSKVTFFITTFSPCYNESHPRYTFGAKNCYILFQPEISFALHDLPQDTPNTEWDVPVTVRDKIRKSYKDAGRPYHIRNTIHYPMAHDMIRPLNNDDKIIKWWIYRDKFI